ncbi:multiheme c-type cytochrome [Hydrocarboniphaga effusa]|uniref:multiheme c-type cytochrome n=1 Tax=Hydrocarboniphaga effusa TaxID=243629 RepID=UPI0035AE2F3A
MIRRRSIVLAALLIVVGVVGVGAAWRLLPGTPSDPAGEFLARHWQKPLAAQGAPPANFSALEASLDPRNCGQCHVAQFESWKQSLHSQTMGAGMLWQLQMMPQDDANPCFDCHAPLAEQKALMARSHHWPAAPATAPPAYVPQTLGHDGLVCAACHVREHARFGPPSKSASTPSPGQTPHGGFTASSAFEDSRFCATCHQFPDDGPRTANKLREDTLNQWRQSRYAAEGRSCQSCHMPDREHRWPGIHSPEMVRSALSTRIEVDAQGQVSASVTNTGAGHSVPTYMVPKLHIELWLIEASSPLGTRLAQDTIGWDVDVSLQHENFDTRLAPGASRVLHATLPALVPNGARLELRAEVAPREHYERSFESMLPRSAGMKPDARRLLEQAIDEARATRYSLVLQRQDLLQPAS